MLLGAAALPARVLMMHFVQRCWPGQRRSLEVTTASSLVQELSKPAFKARLLIYMEINVKPVVITQASLPVGGTWTGASQASRKL